MVKDIFESRRRKLVEEHIKPAGVRDKRLLQAFLDVPRHKFVPLEYKDQAYLDIPLPIGHNQTISQPSLVAQMTDYLQLTGKEKVLEIGTGSGYQAAILSVLTDKVFTIERIPQLATEAKKRFKELKLTNIKVITANGSEGLAEHQPFDAIIVTAAGPFIPQTLIDQLKEGGRMVIPVKDKLFGQSLKVGVKIKGKLKVNKVMSVRFVPLWV